MATVYNGQLTPPKGRFGIVVSRFNEFVTSKLLQGAMDCLHRHGVPDDQVDIVWVPGAVELPLVAQRLAQTGHYVALVCLGCVIQGDTDHYKYVAGEAAKGIVQAALQTGLPVTFGVLTTETLEQAVHRAGVKSGNKGADAALAAIEMANLFSQLPKPGGAD